MGGMCANNGALPVAVGAPEGASGFALGPASPNPTSRKARIRYTVGRESEIVIGVYDVCGRLVRTLVHGRIPAGRHETSWDARDDTGRTVRGGVYFYRMVAGGWQSQQKAIYLAR